MTGIIEKGAPKGAIGVCTLNGFYYWTMPNGRCVTAKKRDWTNAGGHDGITEIVLYDEVPQEPDDHEFIAMLLKQKRRFQ